MGPRLAAAMGKAGLVWGALFIGAGALLASDVLPGTATGPRIGMTAMLLMLGITVLGIAIAPWVAKPDSNGTCPVGWSCGDCGTFNMKRRKNCRSCKAAPTVAGTEHFGEA